MQNRRVAQSIVVVVLTVVLGALALFSWHVPVSQMAVESVSAQPFVALRQPDVRIAVASDLHIHDTDNDGIVKAAVGIDQLLYAGEITQAFGEEATSLHPDAIVLCGDLSSVGRVEQHRAVIEVLDDIENKGQAILVLPGNHDLTAIDREEFAKMYAQFGFDEAISRDMVSCSYVYAVTETVWALMLDTNAYENTEVQYEGELQKETLNWIEAVLKNAQERGATVVSFSHHNVVDLMLEQTPASTIKGSERLSDLFNQYGVRLNVAGHRHAHHVAEGQNGGFYEVVEPLLASYPHAYGWITVDVSAGQINFEAKTVDVEGWAQRNEVASEELLHFASLSKEWSEQNTLYTIESIVNNLDAAEEERVKIQAFLLQLISAMDEGTLSSSRTELLKCEGYRLWQEYGTESNYFFWFEKMLKPSMEIPEGDFSILRTVHFI